MRHEEDVSAQGKNRGGGGELRPVARCVAAAAIWTDVGHAGSCGSNRRRLVAGYH
jgi:hypothetical protein